MHCTHCGNEIPDGARFCTECGLPVDDTEAPVQGRHFEAQGAPGEPSKRKVLVIAGVVALVLAAGAGAVFAFNRSQVGLSAIKSYVAAKASGNSDEQSAKASGSSARSADDEDYDEALSDSDEGNAVDETGDDEEMSAAEIKKARKKAKEDDAGTDESDNVDGEDAGDKPTTSSEYVLPESDTRYYTRSELEKLSDEELKIADNEIFARHGRGFKSQDLQAHFNGCSWYTKKYEPEVYDAMPSQLNQYETANEQLLSQLRAERGV